MPLDKSIHEPQFKVQNHSISKMASRKVVLVTGGNNGIGYETVKALLESEKPYHVLMGSRSLQRAESAIETLKTEVPETSNTVEILQLDLTSDESIEKAFEEVKGRHGYLDVLINNAGTYFISPRTRQAAICKGKSEGTMLIESRSKF